MSTNFGMPGPGGSLGQCALCGKPFLKEILTGQTVKSFRIEGCDQTLYGHADCIVNCPKDILDLPEASPIRQAFVKLKQEQLNQETLA